MKQNRGADRGTFLSWLVIRSACGEAVDWAGDYPSSQDAWEACRRGDWMVWVLMKASVGRWQYYDGTLRMLTQAILTYTFEDEGYSVAAKNEASYPVSIARIRRCDSYYRLPIRFLALFRIAYPHIDVKERLDILAHIARSVVPDVWEYIEKVDNDVTTGQ